RMREEGGGGVSSVSGHGGHRQEAGAPPTRRLVPGLAAEPARPPGRGLCPRGLPPPLPPPRSAPHPFPHALARGAVGAPMPPPPRILLHGTPLPPRTRSGSG